MIGSRVRRVAKHVLNGSLVRFRGPAAGRQIAITFDDGPIEGKTDAVLAILRERACPATFFVIGQHAERAPRLLRAMLEQGCEIGNHTWSHPDVGRLTRLEMTEEIRRADQIIREATHDGPIPFRSPHGDLSPRLLWHLSRTGRLPLVHWSSCPGDEDRLSSSEIVDSLRAKSLSPGEILLLHDDSAATVAALPAILDVIAERDLTPVPLSAMWRGVGLSAGSLR